MTQDIQFDVCHPMIQNMILGETEIKYDVITTSGKSVSGSEVPYRKSLTYSPIIANNNVVFETPKVIANDYNEINLIQNGSGKYNNKSFILKSSMTSSVENLSPVIDLDRTSLITISNRISNYTSATNNISGYDLVTKYTMTGTCYIVAADNSINSSVDVFTDYSIIGKYINLTGTNLSAGNVVNTLSGALLVTEIVSPRKIIVSGKTLVNQISPIVADVVIGLYTNYTSEISPSMGSQESKYLTKPFTLQNAANSIKVYLTGSRTSSCDFDLYYRVGRNTETRLFQNNVWNLMTLDSVPVNNLNYLREYEYSINNTEPFTTVAFKLVMRSVNSSKVPYFDDFRGLALTS